MKTKNVIKAEVDKERDKRDGDRSHYENQKQNMRVTFDRNLDDFTRTLRKAQKKLKVEQKSLKKQIHKLKAEREEKLNTKEVDRYQDVRSRTIEESGRESWAAQARAELQRETAAAQAVDFVPYKT